MADEGTGKIYIIVTNKLPGGSSGEAAIETETRSESSRANDVFKHWAMNKFISTTKSVTRNALNYGLNNIGNFTGNYVMQQQINDVKSFINDLSSIGKAAIAGGVATGSPWGALITATLQTINIGLQKVESYFSIENQTKKINFAINQIRERSGLNSRLDGNRGTEN